MKKKPAGRFDTVLSILAIVFLITLFLLAGGRNAVLQAYTAPMIRVDGYFDDWAGSPTWSDQQNLPGANQDDSDPDDEPSDQKEIQFVEDIRQVSCVENDDGLWFKIDRWEKNGGDGGTAREVFYSVYFDINNDHPTPHPDLRDDWYERFYNYNSVDPETGKWIDWILYCAFYPEEPKDRTCHVYLVPSATVIPDPNIPPSQWPKAVGPVVWEMWGPGGELYNDKTGLGGLSVEFGLPADVMTRYMGITPGAPNQSFQFFFAATFKDPLNHGFYREQDFCPNDYDISRYDIPTLGPVGTAFFLVLIAAIAYASLRRGRPAPTGEAAKP